MWKDVVVKAKERFNNANGEASALQQDIGSHTQSRTKRMRANRSPNPDDKPEWGTQDIKTEKLDTGEDTGATDKQE